MEKDNNSSTTEFVNNILDNNPEPSSEELDTLKTLVNEWFKFDEQIRKLHIATKERKVHQKALNNKIEKFMFDYKYKDLNTQYGRIKANERNVKIPVKMSEIKQKILEFKDLSGEDLLHEIFSDRPTVLKKNIRRVIPQVNLQI
jgi:polyribonucleotide nucleotidyltransferase|tara:strand:- start:2626 stop:3057 length:432 start_codon:yes stop_codon:yes gene_type:complete